ncbi:hypothetical protein A3N99_02645 [Mycobacteroides abscessus]|uniref:hypothetical protein n=1 Tax=Mycobacteroides abscessus TaxID=36809 RepID=UPI00078CE413|nr:hypothetical protein [Mycobacteroides abscessus]AMU39211.1 hypothetical protein A3N99_02645 [Mycobacteroides abscessus]
MQKPTKAFADMMHELADKVQAVLTEMYPDGDNQGALFVSANSLRATAKRYAETAERDLAADTLTAFLASYWHAYTAPPTQSAIEAAHAEASALLAKFDIRPKAGA